MNKMLQVQNLQTGRWENLYVTGLPNPEPTVVQVQQPRSGSGHPLLIAGIIIGALFGLIACLPPQIRGWVVLGLIAGIVWFCWRANTDRAEAYAGTTEPVPAQHYSDYAPRAELVRVPYVAPPFRK